MGFTCCFVFGYFRIWDFVWFCDLVCFGFSRVLLRFPRLRISGLWVSLDFECLLVFLVAAVDSDFLGLGGFTGFLG